MSSKRFLPIDSVLPQIVKATANQPVVLIQAEPGSGKTTRVPAHLLGHFDGEILVLEPRRVAALMAAEFVAREMHEEVGGTVGYRFRFDSRSSPATRLTYLTEGMFIKRLISNPRLENVSAIFLDEFHERHVQTDLAFGLIRRLQQSGRPDLKLILMSATVSGDFLRSKIPDVEVIQAPGRVFSVATEYFELVEQTGMRKLHDRSRFDRSRNEFEAHVVKGIERALRLANQPGEHVLIFLPGMKEIRRVESLLRGRSGAQTEVMCLHGDLSRAEQDSVLRIRKDIQKIILSTNVAESSVTIDGLKVVVDSGLARKSMKPEVNQARGSVRPFGRTEVRPVAQASCIQRANRAGRQAEGFCIRLYSERDYLSRPEFEVPEILRSELSQLSLELIGLGVQSLSTFEWLDQPDDRLLSTSLKELLQFGFIEKAATVESQRDFEPGLCLDRFSLTAKGRDALSLPLGPRGAVLALELSRQKFLPADISRVVAGAIGEDCLQGLPQAASRGFDFEQRKTEERLIQVFQGFQGLAQASAKKGVLASAPAVALSSARPVMTEAALLRALVIAYPEQVALMKSEEQLLLSTGEMGRVFQNRESETKHQSSVNIDKFVFCWNLQENQQGLLVRQLIELPANCEEWFYDVSGDWLRSEVALEFDSNRVTQVERTQFGAIILGEKKSRPSPSHYPEAASILVQQFEKRPGFASLFDKFDFDNWVKRWNFFTSQTSALPPAGAEQAGDAHGARLEGRELWKQLLVTAVAALEDFSENVLKSIDPDSLLNQFLGQSLDPELMRSFENIAPEFIRLPSGRKTRVFYELNQPPYIASRLQDFIGLTETPRVGAFGKISLTVHLLGPNGRPLQVTQDLPGFWTRIYPELRNALSRRYPRHQWP